MGTRETLGRGSVQFMTAGTGVRHSEHNLDESQPLRFIQSWVVPRSRNLQPNYGSMVGDASAEAARKNQWSHIVSDVQAGSTTPVKINQDCNVYVVELEPGVVSPPLAIRSGRQGYMLAVEGEMTLAEERYSRHDACKVQGGVDVEVKAGDAGAMSLVFEMAASQ